MPCTAATYNVTTTAAHTPTWAGTLTVNADGSGTFQPTGGTSSSVTVQCGTEPITGVPWISFNYTAVTPARHYQKATKVANSSPPEFKGSVNNNAGPGGDVDDWIADATGVSADY